MNNPTMQPSSFDQVYDHGHYMPVIMPAMKYIALGHLRIFEILTSILLIYFNMKKIKTFLWNCT